MLPMSATKKITTLKPQYFKMTEVCAESFDVLVDGNATTIKGTSSISVNDNFTIIKENNYRVNVIGYTSKRHQSESGVSIKLKDLNKRYSLDKNNKIYRVEFYKNDDFCFMSKVHFK